MLEFLRRVIRTLQDTTPISAADSAASVPGPVTERLDTPVPIRVSGRGRTFNFHIHARCYWSSEDLRRETLLSYAHYYMPQAIRRLTQLAGEHAAAFPPHRSAELEVALQQALSDAGPWRYKRGDRVVTCQPHVWVDIDERVRKAVQPYWDQLVKLDCEFDVDLTRVRHADRLGREWVAFVENVADGATAGETAGTAGENRTSDVRRIVTELRAAAQRLEDLLGRTQRDADT